MALSLGPDFHPSLGAGSRSWWSLFFFLLRVRNSAARGQSWTARRRRAGGSAPGPREGGSAAAPLPLLFGSASSQSTPSSTSRRVGGGGCKPVGRGTRGASPAPPCGAPPTPIVPRGWGRGLQCEASPAPPAASQKASGAALVPRQIPTLAATTPIPRGTAGRGGARLTVICGMLFLPW